MLTYADAVGLALVVSLLTHQNFPESKETKTGSARVFMMMTRPAFLLLIGWCFKHFFS